MFIKERNQLKLLTQKTKDDSVVQDITSILEKNGSGEYNLSGWIMNEFEKISNKASKEDSKKDKEQPTKDKETKAYIKIELNHDGTTEYFTVEDYAYSYWNRISGTLNLSWKNLESAKIYIENPNLNTTYYMDEISFSKTIDNKKTDISNHDKLESYIVLTIPCLAIVFYIVVKKKKKS